MPDYWCKCNDCGVSFYTANSSPRCPTCHSHNVTVTVLPEETDLVDDDLDDGTDYEQNPHDHY